MTIETRKMEHGRRGVELVDPKTGRRLLSVYSPDGKLERVDTLSSSGALLDRREFYGRRYAHEQFPAGDPARPHRRLWITRAPGGYQLVTTWEQVGNATPRLSATYELALEANACDLPPPIADLDTTLSGINWGEIHARAEADGFRALGYNFRATPSCSAYPGGFMRLSGDLANALSTTIECMRNLGPDSATDAARVLSATVGPSGARVGGEPMPQSWNNPVTLYCGQSGAEIPVGPDSSETVRILGSEVGVAYDCTSAGYPGFGINLSHPDQVNAGVLAHEILHLMGYRHSDGVDVPYLAQACCFGGRDQRACQLLTNRPPSTLTEAYGLQYTAVMEGLGRIDLAAEHLVNEAVREGNPAALAGYATFVQGRFPTASSAIISRGDGSALASVIGSEMNAPGSGAAALARIFPPPRDASGTTAPDVRSQFATELSAAAAAILRGDRAAFETQMTTLRPLAARACAGSSLNTAERNFINDLTRTSRFRAAELTGDTQIGDAGLENDWYSLCRTP